MSKESSLRGWERSLSPKVDAKPANLHLRRVQTHQTPRSADELENMTSHVRKAID
jgi:hypothetical protein